MKLSQGVSAVLCCACWVITCVLADAGVAVMTQFRDDDHGHLDNCGDSKHDFNFTWIPTTLHVNDYAKVSASIMPAVALHAGTLCYNASVPWAPDPIYKDCFTFTCADIDQYAPGICPFTAGKLAQFMDQLILIHTSATITPAPYILHGTIMNEFKELFVCFNGTVDVG